MDTTLAVSRQHLQETEIIISLHVEEEKWHQNLEMRSRTQICTNCMKKKQHDGDNVILLWIKNFDQFAVSFVHYDWKEVCTLKW